MDVPEICRCELSYVNLFDQEKLAEFDGGYKDLFTDLNRDESKERFLNNPTSLNWHAVYHRPEEDLNLSTKVQTVTRITDKSSAFRFEISANDTRPSPTLNDTENWFDTAHNVVVASFLDLTSTKAQTELWKRIHD